MQHDFEVYGSKGALCFSQERFNELHFYASRDAPGHQIGFNDLKAIEIAEYVGAIAEQGPEPFSFRKGFRVQKLVESIINSSISSSWINV